MEQNIKTLIKEYSKLCKEIDTLQKDIKKKRESFQASIKNKQGASVEVKRALFHKEIKSLLVKINDLEHQKRVLETKYEFHVSLGELISELSKSFRATNGNELQVIVDPVQFPWGKVQPSKLQEYIQKGLFTASIDITIFNNMTTFYYLRRLQLGPYLKFADNGRLKDNVKINNSTIPTQINFVNDGNIMIPFTLKELFKESDAWDSKTLRNAVVSIVEKHKPIM